MLPDSFKNLLREELPQLVPSSCLMSVSGIGIGHTGGHAPAAQGGLVSAVRASHQPLSIPVQSGASQPGIPSTSHGAPLSTPRAGFIKMKEEKQRKKFFTNDRENFQYPDFPRSGLKLILHHP